MHLNMADIVVLSLLAIVVGLIIRGMLGGAIKTCDTSSCSGNCGNCGSKCATPRITLTEAQQAQLQEIDRKAGRA